MAFSLLTTDTNYARTVLGERNNRGWAITGIPAQNVANHGGLLVFEGVDAGGTTYNTLYLGVDSSNNLRMWTSAPASTNAGGSVIGTSTGASIYLDNLGATAVNASIVPNANATLNLGSSTYYWDYLYATRQYVNATAYWDGTTAGTQTATGNIAISAGILTVDNVSDAANYIKRNVSAGTTTLLEVKTTHTADQGLTFLVTQAETGAYDAMRINHAGTGYGLKITGSAVTGKQLDVVGPASQTTSQIYVDGSTGGWIGAANIGQLHINGGAGTLAVATATALYITSAATTASSALGSCFRINDACTSGGGTSYAAYITSTSMNCLGLVSVSTTMRPLLIQGAASTTVSLLQVTATSWVGASTVGAITIAHASSALVAGASCLRVSSSQANTAASYVVDIASSGSCAGSTLGIALHVVESGAAAGTSYAGYFASTSNTALGVYAGAVGSPTCNMWGIQAQTAAVLTLTGGTGTGWVGAATTGILTITHSAGTLASATASCLYIACAGTTAASATGSSLYINDTATAGGATSIAAYISSSLQHALTVTTGTVTKNVIQVLPVTASTASSLLITGSAWVGAATTGELHITGTGTLASATASCLYIAHSGTSATAATGSSIFVNDSAAAGSAASIATYFYSASQHAGYFGTGAAAKTPLQLAGANSATASVLSLTSGTGFVGAATTGLVNIAAAGTLASATASMLYIAFSGTSAAAATGSSLYINDTATAGGATSIATYVYSGLQHAMAIATGTVTKNALQILPVTASTASSLVITGGAWVGAATTGMLHITGTGTLASASASLVYIANAGASAASNTGSSLFINDTSTAGAGAYVAYITSTTNSLLALVGATTTTKNQLTISGPAAQTASYVAVTGTFVGAATTGLLSIANSGNLASVSASLMRVVQSGTVTSSSTGICAQFLDTSANSGTSYAVQIDSTNNRGLNVSTGESSFVAGLATKMSTYASGAPPTQAQLVTGLGAANSHASGWFCILNPNSDTNNYLVWTDGTSWWYVAGTKPG